MISTTEEFKQVIEGDYKILDIPSYNEYKKKMWEEGIPREAIEKLSPDNVNSCSFWEYIEKNPELAKDAISFGVTKDKSIHEANIKNFGLACQLGTLNFLFNYKECNCPVLDIGAGYGMLKGVVQEYTKLQYYGVDVYPKIPGVLQVGTDGSTLPEEIMKMKGSFAVVVATNVFQHLSVKQRRHYYEQVAQLLYPTGGVFSVSQLALFGNMPNGFKAKDDGKYYVCHYGQYTEVQPIVEIAEDLSKHFSIISTQHRHDFSVTHHCVLKPTPKPEPADAN